MNLKERLIEAQGVLAEVKAAVEAGEKSAEDLSNAIENVKSIQTQIDAAEEADKLIKSLGVPEDAPAEKENEKMTVMEELAQKAAEMKDRKSGISMHIKAAATVVTAPQIADVDKSVAAQPKRVAAADFFSFCHLDDDSVC